MGASSSKKSAKQRKPKHKQHKSAHPRDVVRGQPITDCDRRTHESPSNSPRTHTGTTLVTHSDSLETGPHYDTPILYDERFYQPQPDYAVKTDIPGEGDDGEGRVQQPVYSVLEDSQGSHEDRRNRYISQRTISSEEEYLDVPAIIRR